MESKEPSGEKMPSSKSLGELADLLAKLHAKIRDKVGPLARKRQPGKTDMIIIVLTHEEQKNSKSRVKKPEPGRDWIHELCEEIEHRF